MSNFNFDRRPSVAERLHARNTRPQVRPGRVPEPVGSFISGMALHVILGGLTVLTGLAMIVLSVMVAFGSLAGEWLFGWIVPVVLFLAVLGNFARTIIRAGREF